MIMTYTNDMNLISDSGYCMPFDDRNGTVELILPYGEQIHPKSGETFFHHGVDFKTEYFLLSALADGKVIGIGSDARHGLYVNIQYGGYTVRYAHLSSCIATFGELVVAGRMVGVSSELLHLEVHYNEEEINPIDFITMLYSNMKTSGMQNGGSSTPEFVSIEADVITDYDAHKNAIEEMMLRFYPEYMEAIRQGEYTVGKHTEQSLRNIFTVSAVKNYFFETIPSLANPLGISAKAIPVATKVQNLLIADFVNYLALKHHVFLPGLTENEKKK